jgi:peptidoglycan/LPS O-acetylase OafA/YrhL
MSIDKRFDYLTSMRGISAFVVVLNHCQDNGTEYFGNAPTLELTGIMAVYFFFVLSAFLLTYRAFCELFPSSKTLTSPESQEANLQLDVLDESEERKPHPNLVLPTKSSIGFYFLRRFFRIYPAYTVALLLSEPPPFFTERFFKRLFLLNTEYAHFWALRVEIWYYAIIPLIQVGCAFTMNLDNKHPRRRISFHIMFLLLVTVFPVYQHYIGGTSLGIIDFFPIFWYGSLAGIAFFYLKRKGYILTDPQGRMKKFYFYMAEIMTYGIIVVITLSHASSSLAFIGTETWWSDASPPSLALVYCVLLLILTLTDGNTSMGKFFHCNLLLWLGKISYSVYLVNYAPIDLIKISNIRGLEANIAVVILECALGGVTCILVEEPGVKLGNFLIRRIKVMLENRAQRNQHRDTMPLIEGIQLNRVASITIENQVL